MDENTLNGQTRFFADKPEKSYKYPLLHNSVYDTKMTMSNKSHLDELMNEIESRDEKTTNLLAGVSNLLNKCLVLAIQSLQYKEIITQLKKFIGKSNLDTHNTHKNPISQQFMNGGDVEIF